MTRVVARRWVVVVLVAATWSTARGAEERFDWMPAEGVAASLHAVGGEMIIPEIIVTPTPKATSDIAKFTNIYTIDLAKFGIHNDGTHAVETSAGLNRALQEAKGTGANRIVFPAGTYLISETDPLVLDHRNTIVDLNGATLQINANGLPKYGVIDVIDGAENLRLTNGTLRGDKDVHDYKADPSTHEWGAGIHFYGGRNLEVDHITSHNMTGDGVSTLALGSRNRDELLKLIKHSLFAKELESGGFNDRGEKKADATRIRSIKPLDVTKYGGRFEIGYFGGYMGYPFIKGRVYQACFYDAEMKFLGKQKTLQYRKVELPEGAAFMHLEFNQPEVSDEPAHVGAVKGGWLVRIMNCCPSTDVHFHHNVLKQNRRLGMAYCGGQRWLIEENRFEENGGTNPAYGVDLEDGSEMMQDVVFRRNKFKGNRGGDLVVCAGSELIFEENEFEKSVITWGRPHNYVFRNNSFRGGLVSYTTRTGVAKIHDNKYENCKLAIRFDTKGVADGLLRTAGQSVATPPLRLENETLTNVTDVSGTYFDFAKCKIAGSQLTAGAETRLIRLTDCQVSASTIVYEEAGPAVNVKLENIDGKPTESGPGLAARRRDEVKAASRP